MMPSEGDRRPREDNIVTRCRENLNADPEAIESFCRRWQVTELSLFGSALRAVVLGGAATRCAANSKRI